MDIYVYEYPSPKSRNTLSIKELAETMNLVLTEDGILNYQDVLFLSHSMGGLVTRSLLLKYRDDWVKKVKALLFFATPTTGTTVAEIGKLLSSIRN